MNLPRTIRELREKKKLSQAELAITAGLSTPYISEVERGKKSPTVASLQKISKALDIPLPILSFLSLDDDDISAEKKEAFKMLDPAIKAMVKEFFL